MVELYSNESRGNALAVTRCELLLGRGSNLFSSRAAAREREDEEVRRKYRTATEYANDGFYMAAPVRDRKGEIVNFNIIDCNERGAYFCGFQRTEPVGREVSSIGRGLGSSELIDIYRLAMSNGFHEEVRRMP